VNIGKRSDKHQCVKETAGASKVSDEVMTNVVFVVRREVCMLTKIERREK